MGGLLPVVTENQKGLVEANGFRNLGFLPQEQSLDDVLNGYGYSYTENDGTGFGGMFISVSPNTNYTIQIKIASNAAQLLFRAKGNGSWFKWKTVTFTDLETLMSDM